MAEANVAKGEAIPAERGMVERIGSGIGAFFSALGRDGHLAAAWRQGIDEFATALKAFPDSISVSEQGTIWNPTPGEIQAARDPSKDHLPSPSSIRHNADYSNEQERGQEQGRDMD